MRLNIKLRISILLFMFLFSVPLASSEYPTAEDAKGHVQLFDLLLREGKGRYRLHLIEAFQNERQWTERGNSSSLSDIRFIHNAPPVVPFQEDWEMIHRNDTHSRQFTIEKPYSLLIHFFFSIPGKQSFRIYPKTPVLVPQGIFRASLWVRSKNYNHKLYLVFRKKNGKEVFVHAGRLKFDGWRRLNIPLPAREFARERLVEEGLGLYFTGIAIQSDYTEEASDVALQFDTMCVLEDRTNTDYPGREISDTWK